MSTRSKMTVTGCGVVGVLAVLLLALGVSAYAFQKYRVTLNNVLAKSTPIMIAITDPHSGQAVPAGTPLLVHVNAGSPNPLVALELWANGEIVGIQAAPPPNGITPFSADFTWTPAQPGDYTLIARGLQAGHQSTASTGVALIVGATEKIPAEDGAADTGQSIPSSNGWVDGSSSPLPASPSPPSAPESIGPAQPWKFTLLDWLLGGSDDLPQAPELTAVPEGCGATLSIHDLSDSEDGFIVFRMTASAPMLTKIVTLDGQSQLEWLTYTDSSYTSDNSYMVREFKGAKFEDSNIAFAKGDPADCKSFALQLPQLSIQLTTLKTDVDADMVYCYQSVNGVDWSRVPMSGFFMPGPDGFDIQDQAESILLNELDGKSLTLDLECWGWVGGALQLLGKLHQDGIDPNMGEVELAKQGLAVGLSFGGSIQTKDGDPPPKAPTDPKMPKVFAILFYGPDACTEHLPGGGDNLFENLLFCSWFPEYNFDDGESQPYLVWYVSDGLCVNGSGPDCNSFQSYLQRAKAYGGQVGFHVYGQLADSIPVTTTPYDLTAFVVPPQTTCGQDTLFMTVRMFFQGGPNDPDYPNQLIEGPDSNTVASVFNCPPPSEVKLDVVFDTLHIADLGDGATGGDDLEVYASFVAEGRNPGNGSVLNVGEWGWSGDQCLGDGPHIGLQSGGEPPECPVPVKEGETSIAGLQLCTSTTYSKCVGTYALNNNKIQVTVGDGSRIRVAVHAMDYDVLSGDDEVCNAETWIGPESIFGWQGFSVSGEMSHGDNGTASCIVSFHVVPSP